MSGTRVFHDLKEAIRAGTAKEIFPVGTVLPDTWTDKTGTVYPMSRIIVDYRMMRLSNRKKRLGAILLSQDAIPFALRFSEGGGNVFAQSDLKQWLNDREGYLSGCTPELLDAVADVIIDDSVLVKFYPPSLEELHLDPYQNPDLEDLVFEYFRDTPTDYRVVCPKRAFRDASGIAQHCWLRSAYRGSSRNVWLAFTDGSAYSYGAHTTYACAQLCVIA